jgi:hypothetical protein
MIKKMLLLSCALGLFATLPANASPTKKTITIACSSVDPDVIYGRADVMIFDSSGSSSQTCSVTCGTSGSPGLPESFSTDCPLPFRASEVSYILSYTASDTSSPNYPTDGVISEGTVDTTAQRVQLKGRGISVQVGPTNTGDTVTLKVK